MESLTAVRKERLNNGRIKLKMISEVDTDGVPSCLSLSAARWIESGVFRRGVIGVTYYNRTPDSVSGKSDGC